MNQLDLSEVVDSWGRIRNIREFRSHPRILSALSFEFENGERLGVEAVPDDDTIRTVQLGRRSDDWKVVSTLRPLHLLVDCDLLWVWRLENQQGYQDGLQICTARGSVHSTVQFIVVASSLTIYDVTLTPHD